jgi:hypothetical protein
VSPVSEHPSINRKERDIVTLSELLDSDGWALLCDKTIYPDIARSMRAVFEYSLRGETDRAGKEAAHGDAMIELLRSVYTKADREIPEQVQRLKKGHVNEHD